MERMVRIAKKLLPFAGAAVFLLAVYAIHRELAGVRLSELRAAFAETGAEDAALALLAVALNYAVLAANEALAVAEGGGGLPWRRTAPVSFIANAVGFNLGASRDFRRRGALAALFCARARPGAHRARHSLDAGGLRSRADDCGRARVRNRA